MLLQVLAGGAAGEAQTQTQTQTHAHRPAPVQPQLVLERLTEHPHKAFVRGAWTFELSGALRLA